jgi:hypothetical protein
MVKSSRAGDADPGSHFQGGEEEKSPCEYITANLFFLLDYYPTLTLRFLWIFHQNRPI